ncbi:hypothetical protein [Microbulbifer agarilyticus]
MKSSIETLFLVIPGLFSAGAFAVEEDFWDRSYQQCFQSADVVVEGRVIGYEKVGYNGNEKFGYSHYLISIEVLKSIKGFEGSNLKYHVWYEGKKHDIEGNSLFCLCANDKGEYGDPEGFGRLSLGTSYQSYLAKRAAGKIKPIDEQGKYYVPYCGA